MQLHQWVGPILHEEFTGKNLLHLKIFTSALPQGNNTGKTVLYLDFPDIWLYYEKIARGHSLALKCPL